MMTPGISRVLDLLRTHGYKIEKPTFPNSPLYKRECPLAFLAEVEGEITFPGNVQAELGTYDELLKLTSYE